MPGLKRGRIILTAIVLLAAGLFCLVFLRYRRDIHRARERVSTGSTVVETPCGPIEYATAGEGRPVLVVHGAGGGFDQGIYLSRPLAANGFRVIAMSRFGYLRTPLTADASAAAQAKAHACLLDALNTPRVAVVGASAGAPSSMQFALRYPERTAALVLLVPAAYPFHIRQRPAGAMPERTSTETRFLFDTALKSDFLFWLAPRIARRTVVRAILGTPPWVVERASADEQARVAGVLARILPVAPRRLGLLNDAAITSSLPRYDLERITAPTLIVSFPDDLFGTYEGARYSAEYVPGARFISYPSGGHLWVGHQEELMRQIADFLRKAA